MLQVSRGYAYIFRFIAVVFRKILFFQRITFNKIPQAVTLLVPVLKRISERGGEITDSSVQNLVVRICEEVMVRLLVLLDFLMATQRLQ